MSTQHLHRSRQRPRLLTYGALIASLYTVLTYLSAMLGLSGGIIQLRLSEALTILPALLPLSSAPAAVGGLFVGCILANAITGAMLWDIVLGSIATLLGALGTLYLRRHPYLAWIAPVLSNTSIVPLILQKVYGLGDAYLLLALPVCIGELLSAGVLGMLLYRFFHRRIKNGLH